MMRTCAYENNTSVWVECFRVLPQAPLAAHDEVMRLSVQRSASASKAEAAKCTSDQRLLRTAQKAGASLHRLGLRCDGIVMLRAAVLPLLVALPAMAQLPENPADEETPTFQAGVNLVEVPVTVGDRDGRAVAGLQKDDFGCSTKASARRSLRSRR